MKTYRTTLYNNDIRCLEVIKTTEHFIWYNDTEDYGRVRKEYDRREKIKGISHKHFAVEQEAVEYLRERLVAGEKRLVALLNEEAGKELAAFNAKYPLP